MPLDRALLCSLLAVLTVADRDKNAAFAPHDGAFVAPLSSCNQTMVMSGLASGLDQNALLFTTGLDKRQSCQSGYGLCEQWNICCPNGAGAQCCQDSASCVTQGQTCCSAAAGVDACDVGQKCCQGGCAPAGSTCCSGGRYCDGEFPQCCEGGGCVPQGAQCCDGFSADGRRKYCEPGNNCYAFDDAPNDIFCCTNSACTARIENGATITVTSAIPTPSQFARTTQITRTVYYTFTYTWYYYRYFFTIYQQASAVTSTIETTTTIFSVQATNSIEASSLATVQLATITAIPPVDASTQLATYSVLATASGTTESLPTAGIVGGGGSDDGETETVTATMRTTATQAVSGQVSAAVSVKRAFTGYILLSSVVLAVVLC